MSTILIVDDSPTDQRIVGGLLRSTEWTLKFATNGADAVAAMSAEALDLVITDLMMPGMSGLDLVGHIVSHHPHLPVILMTGDGSEETAVRALEAGAASYVPKSALAALLADTVRKVLDAARAEWIQKRLMNSMTRSDSSFVLENDLQMIPPLVDFLHRSVRCVGLCDERSGIRICIALEEALSNAMFHGNLELQSELRVQNRDAYRSLLETRQRTTPYCDRRLYVDARLTGARGEFVIRDEGRGFNPATLPDPTEPANLENPSGRGLLLMRTFMDEMTFNETGNQVTLVKLNGSRTSLQGDMP